MESPRWNIITPSQYEWERRGLDFIRTGLPNHDPYCAWANFEFQTGDGAIYEVDLLVLTKQGFWLVESKAWGVRISGDTGTWTRSQDGKLRSEDNPVLLANRKAKALASVLKAQPATSKIRLPWLDALVFLSADDVQCDLSGNSRHRVLLKDRPKTDARPEQKGILAALINREGPGIDADLRGTIDITVAKALSRAMDTAGIRPSQSSHHVGDHILPFLPILRYKTTALRKRAVWERTWELQRQQDAGKHVGDIPVPPKYATADFLKTDYSRLRGKLDVPKERWISYPHCSTDSDPSLVVGWAGWNHLEQATALVAYYDARKREGWDAKRLTPLLAGLDQLLPWIHQWHPEIHPEFGETAGKSFQTMLAQDAHELGLTLEDIRNWTPPAKKSARRKAKA